MPSIGQPTSTLLPCDLSHDDRTFRCHQPGILLAPPSANGHDRRTGYNRLGRRWLGIVLAVSAFLMLRLLSETFFVWSNLCNWFIVASVNELNESFLLHEDCAGLHYHHFFGWIGPLFRWLLFDEWSAFEAKCSAYRLIVDIAVGMHLSLRSIV